MSRTIAIIAPGAMGAAVANCLTAKGATVLTALNGRSEASRRRAATAGMRDANEAALVEADFLLSIVPPGDAVALAQHLAPILAASSKRTVYVDCNAVSPPTAQEVADVIAPTGCGFIDASIIGPPPKPGSTSTKFYASGPHATELAVLNDFGLIVRPMEGPLTAASALKMAYAGLNKGVVALGAAMMLAATRSGSAEALKAEMAESRPELLTSLERSIPDMYSKAYRWVAEFEEIAGFVGTDRPESEIFAAGAKFFADIAKDVDGDNRETAALDAFFKR